MDIDKFEHLRNYRAVTSSDEFQKASQLAILNELHLLNQNMAKLIGLMTPKSLPTVAGVSAVTKASVQLSMNTDVPKIAPTKQAITNTSPVSKSEEKDV